MTQEEKVKRAAWRIARRATSLGYWGANRDLNGAQIIVKFAKDMAADLEERGCFNDKYGDNGSLEVDLAPFVLAKFFVGDWQHNPTYNFGVVLFDGLKRIVDGNLLSDEEKARSRYVDKANEDAEAERKKAEAASKAEEDRKRKEREEIEERKKAAKARLAQIQEERKL